ncbi:hypothetical protein QUF63_09975 [Anaerolineales bacterium HSG25]|nr:hypothetical protein [Anaerolineales bacterium HSG25]
MIKRTQRWLLLIIVVTGSMVGGILAQENTPILQRNLWNATDNPVTDTDNHFRLSGSLGEPIVGQAVVTNSYHLQTGFWSEGMVRQTTRVYLPVVTRK